MVLEVRNHNRINRVRRRRFGGVRIRSGGAQVTLARTVGDHGGAREGKSRTTESAGAKEVQEQGPGNGKRGPGADRERTRGASRSMRWRTRSTRSTRPSNSGVQLHQGGNRRQVVRALCAGRTGRSVAGTGTNKLFADEAHRSIALR